MINQHTKNDNIEQNKNIEPENIEFLYNQEDENRDILNNIFSNLNKKERVKLKENSQAVDEKLERFKLDSEIIRAVTDSIKKDSSLRKGYAITLIIIFIAFLTAYNTIFILCGLSILKFSETTLNIYATGGIIEVIALLKIIVGYLFKDNISEPLKNVLEKNKSDK